MAASRLRIGVLGASRIGFKALVPAIQASRNAEVVAVASRDGDRARAFAAQLGIARPYATYEALLDDPDVDAVYVSLPTALHGEWGVRAAEKHKHILCEKPLATTAPEGRAMQAAADARGVILMEAFMYRFHPRTTRLLELVRSHGGAMSGIHSAFTFVPPAISIFTRVRQKLGAVRRRIIPPALWPERVASAVDLGRGALFGLGSYCVDLGRLLAGSPPIDAKAVATWSRNGVDEHLTGSLRFPSGVTMDFECGRATGARQTARVQVSETFLTAERCFVPGRGPTEILEERGTSVTRHTIDPQDQYRLMVEHFADAALMGTPLRYGIADSAANLAAIAALYESARSGGRPVTVQTLIQ